MSRTGCVSPFPALVFPALAVPALVLALSGCNTTEALTPQVDVGHNTSQSTPVTQGDLDQMAAAADRAPAGASATASSVPAYAPQNSLQAQAQALSSGSQYGEPLGQALHPHHLLRVASNRPCNKRPRLLLPVPAIPSASCRSSARPFRPSRHSRGNWVPKHGRRD